MGSPGFSFILVVIALNCVPLLEIISPTERSEFLGVALALFSLFTASAIGFLTTQWYWWRYNKGGQFLGLREIQKIVPVLERYGFNSQKNEKERKKAFGAILDFAVYSGAGDRFLNYIWRRWDIFHLLETTRVALLTGILVGLAMRAYFEIWYFQVFFLSPEKLEEHVLQVYLRIENAEIVGLALILIAIFVSAVVLRKTSKTHMESYYPIYEAFVRKSMDQCETEIREAFPEYFEQVLCPECGRKILKKLKTCPYCYQKLNG